MEWLSDWLMVITAVFVFVTMVMVGWLVDAENARRREEFKQVNGQNWPINTIHVATALAERAISAFQTTAPPRDELAKWVRVNYLEMCRAYGFPLGALQEVQSTVVELLELDAIDTGEPVSNFLLEVPE